MAARRRRPRRRTDTYTGGPSEHLSEPPLPPPLGTWDGMRHFLKRPPRRETPFKRHLSSLNLPSVASSSSVAPVQTHTHGEGGQSESSLVNPFLLPRSLARLDGRIDSMAELFGQSSVTKSILHFKGDAANGQPAQARRRAIAVHLSRVPSKERPNRIGENAGSLCTQSEGGRHTTGEPSTKRRGVF